MRKIQWTLQPEADLETILAYYLQLAGFRVTEVIYQRIRQQIQELAQFPERTRVGRVAGTREYVLARLPYVAVIALGEEAVTILNIVHTARQYPPNSD